MPYYGRSISGRSPTGVAGGDARSGLHARRRQAQGAARRSGISRRLQDDVSARWPTRRSSAPRPRSRRRWRRPGSRRRSSPARASRSTARCASATSRCWSAAAAAGSAASGLEPAGAGLQPGQQRRAKLTNFQGWRTTFFDPELNRRSTRRWSRATRRSRGPCTSASGAGTRRWASIQPFSEVLEPVGLSGRLPGFALNPSLGHRPRRHHQGALTPGRAPAGRARHAFGR